MIVGFGVDLCSVKRMERLALDNLFLRRVFHEGERTLALGPQGPARLAARWAAREAFAKASGLGMAALGFRGVEVVSSPQGPKLVPHSPKAHEVFRRCKVFLSLSHEGDMAVAAVVLEERT